ncbi:MAG: VOC family protein [Robiginitomaculum sp.]|nr:VOC family protein [Robiginitomaculum sp.]
MIGYQTVGTNKLNEAAAFYDTLLGELGAKRTMEDKEFVLWSTGPGTPGFCVHIPENGKTATIGNGSMTAFYVEAPKMVDKMYALAMKLGASDEGSAGPRGDDGFYAGFCRDLDGNKFSFFCMTEPKT